MHEIDDRPGYPTCSNEVHEPGCPCRAGGDAIFKKIQIRTAAFWHGAGIPSTQIELTSGPAAQGVILALADGRLVQIADLGAGTRISVVGPDAEVLGDWDLPSVAQSEPEATLWCRLRGRNVPISECVASCPAPEQREVCAMEYDPNGSLEIYQAEGR